jgi:pyridoxal phosphate enzyme (YggS family)
MPIDKEMYQRIRNELNGKAELVAVSKTKTAEDILALYNEGQRDFGENYVQELVDKRASLPEDIRWHFIGHLQRNKVKQIISFVYLIHGVDSLDLLQAINWRAEQAGRVVDVLLQVHVAREETKFGFDAGELRKMLFMGNHGPGQWPNVRIRGLMGMASNTEDMEVVRAEFHALKDLFDQRFPEGGVLSMGMSGDYQLAVKEGSTMVRVGSLLFGKRG